MARILIGNLPYDCTVADVVELVKGCGGLVDKIEIPRDPSVPWHKGFAVVFIAGGCNEAMDVIEQLRECTLGERSITACQYGTLAGF